MYQAGDEPDDQHRHDDRPGERLPQAAPTARRRRAGVVAIAAAAVAAAVATACASLAAGFTASVVVRAATRLPRRHRERGRRPGQRSETVRAHAATPPCGADVESNGSSERVIIRRRSRESDK